MKLNKRMGYLHRYLDDESSAAKKTEKKPIGAKAKGEVHEREQGTREAVS